jgi:hypothetical protein
MTRRVRAFALLVLVGGIVLASISRRGLTGRAEAHRREVREATTRLLGTADLALSSSSRWLRHPSQAEPGAAFADAPASLDPDPGGAAIGPPLPILRAGGPTGGPR